MFKAEPVIVTDVNVIAEPVGEAFCNPESGAVYKA
jgi:hypothetical protein